MTPAVAGLVLAAGAGRRMGTPKALLDDTGGSSLVDVAVDRLVAAGCDPVVVVLGADAEQARGRLRDRRGAARCSVVVAEDWAEGMGASLRRGLEALEGEATAAAVLVTLVDLPDVDERVMDRVVDGWREDGAAADGLARATYDGRPGHPVLIGRDHWAALRETLSGDRGAQPYLRGRIVREVSCEDLATGRDVDRPEDLP